MSFAEKDKYGSMDKAFQAGKDKEKKAKVLFLNKRDEFLSSRNDDGDEMSDEDFELLKQDLEMTMLKLNLLQGKYRKQVGKDFVLPIRL